MNEPCEAITERLITGSQLEPDDEHHLERCSRCATRAALPARLRRASARVDEPPLGFDTRLAAAARDRLSGGRARRWPAVAAAASLVVIAGAALWLLDERDSQPPTTARSVPEQTGPSPDRAPDPRPTDTELTDIADTDPALAYAAGRALDDATGKLDALREDTDLDDDQRARVRRIADEVDETIARLEARIDILSIDLRGEIESDVPDPDAIARTIERIGELEAQVRKARVLGWLRARAAIGRGPAPDVGARATVGTHGPDVPEGADPPTRPGKLELDSDRPAVEDPFAGADPSDADERHGKLGINALPHARVYIDGEHRGRTPVLVELPLGRHAVELRREGFRVHRRTLQLEPGKTVRLNVQLSRK